MQAKPETETLCPASGKRLRLKELTPVRFTPVPEKLKASLGRKATGNAVPLYMDPISREIFTNSSRLVVLKPTGTVMTKQSYEKCVKPEGFHEGRYKEGFHESTHSHDCF